MGLFIFFCVHMLQLPADST